MYCKIISLIGKLYLNIIKWIYVKDILNSIQINLE